MSDTVGNVINRARGMIGAALSTEMTTLSSPFTQGDPSISVSVERRVAPGSVLCVGLTTFQAMAVSGNVISVVQGADGSPSDDYPAGEPVLIRPSHTTWQAFEALNNVVAEVSSPVHGLYQVNEEEFPVDVVDGTYVLPTLPTKILRVRYRRPGSTDEWDNLPWTYQPGAPLGPTVRTGQAPGGTTVHVQYGVPYRRASRLSETLDGMSVPIEASGLLATGVARDMSLSLESRRVQPFTQGDPRRAEEVPSTGNVVVYDRLNRRFRELVQAERARLLSQYPYRHQMEQFV
jgi:hypothetical protein